MACVAACERGCHFLRLHTTAREPKRAHLRVPLQTPPKFHEKTPREGRRERIFRREREKKSEILGRSGGGQGGPGEGRSWGRAALGEGRPWGKGGPGEGRSCQGKGGPARGRAVLGEGRSWGRAVLGVSWGGLRGSPGGGSGVSGGFKPRLTPPPPF